MPHSLSSPIENWCLICPIVTLLRRRAVNLFNVQTSTGDLGVNTSFESLVWG